MGIKSNTSVAADVADATRKGVRIGSQSIQHIQEREEALPPSWFPSETHAVLAELVQTIVQSNRVAAELRKIKSLARTTSFNRFMELTRAKIQQSEIIGRLSTKLRCTNQSRMSDRQAGNEAQRSTIKPWDLTGDGADDRADESAPPYWGPTPTRKN